MGMMMHETSGKANFELIHDGQASTFEQTFQRSYPDSQKNPYKNFMKRVVLFELSLQLFFGPERKDFSNPASTEPYKISFFTYEHSQDAPNFDFVLKTVGAFGEQPEKYLLKDKCELVFTPEKQWVWMPDGASAEEKAYFSSKSKSWLKRGEKYRKHFQKHKEAHEKRNTKSGLAPEKDFDEQKGATPNMDGDQGQKTEMNVTESCELPFRKPPSDSTEESS